MTIKHLGGVFGRNPTFNDVTIEGELIFEGGIDINSDLTIDGVTTVRVDSDGATAEAFNVYNLGAGNNTQVRVYFGAGEYNTIGRGLRIDAGRDSGADGIATFYSVDQAEHSDYEAIKILTDGGVTLSHLGNNKLATSSTGIDVTGNIAVNSGNGIDFSATSGTGTSELFDDYEEGTWTPSPTGGTLTVNDATYTKVGRLVTAQADVTATATTSGDWSGLPFNLGGNASADKQAGFVGYQTEESSAVWGILADNTLPTFTFRNGSAGKQLTTGSRAVFTIIYYTD